MAPTNPDFTALFAKNLPSAVEWWWDIIPSVLQKLLPLRRALCLCWDAKRIAGRKHRRGGGGENE
eukprot:3920200-Prorocentrum_lima.AAC.1